MNAAVLEEAGAKLDREFAKRQSETAPSPALPEWTTPLREIKADLPPAPDFDAHALLPAVLAEFVLDEADRMPCAPDYVASALLVALGSVRKLRAEAQAPRRLDRAAESLRWCGRRSVSQEDPGGQCCYALSRSPRSQGSRTA